MTGHYIFCDNCKSHHYNLNACNKPLKPLNTEKPGNEREERIKKAREALMAIRPFEGIDQDTWNAIVYPEDHTAKLEAELAEAHSALKKAMTLNDEKLVELAELREEVRLFREKKNWPLPSEAPTVVWGKPLAYWMKLEEELAEVRQQLDGCRKSIRAKIVHDAREKIIKELKEQLRVKESEDTIVDIDSVRIKGKPLSYWIGLEEALTKISGFSSVNERGLLWPNMNPSQIAKSALMGEK